MQIETALNKKVDWHYRGLRLFEDCTQRAKAREVTPSQTYSLLTQTKKRAKSEKC